MRERTWLEGRVGRWEAADGSEAADGGGGGRARGGVSALVEGGSGGERRAAPLCGFQAQTVIIDWNLQQATS